MSAVAIILAGLEGYRRKYLERLASLEISINTDHARNVWRKEGNGLVFGSEDVLVRADLV